MWKYCTGVLSGWLETVEQGRILFIHPFQNLDDDIDSDKVEDYEKTEDYNAVKNSMIGIASDRRDVERYFEG